MRRRQQRRRWEPDATAAERAQSDAGNHRQHGDDEQYVPYAVVDGRTLNDEKSERQNNGRAYDKTSPPARRRQAPRTSRRADPDAMSRQCHARSNTTA